MITKNHNTYSDFYKSVSVKIQSGIKQIFFTLGQLQTQLNYYTLSAWSRPAPTWWCSIKLLLVNAIKYQKNTHTPIYKQRFFLWLGCQRQFACPFLACSIALNFLKICQERRIRSVEHTCLSDFVVSSRLNIGLSEDSLRCCSQPDKSWRVSEVAAPSSKTPRVEWCRVWKEVDG